MPSDRHPQSPLSGIDLFAPLSFEELQRLGRSTPDVSLREGQIFYTPRHSGESFFLLLEGRMRIYRGVGAREQTLTVVRPGTFFGEAALATLAQSAYAQALVDSKVAIMHRAALHRLVEDRPKVGMVMIELLIERLNVYENQLEEMGLKETPARLASLILRLTEDEGIRQDEEYEIPYYTHELLSTMVGCGRPALTRALQDLRDAGAVRTRGRRIYVVDTQALERVAG